MKAEFIQIKGKNYFVQGEKFIPRGLNLGNWLLIESFMHGLPSVENDMHRQMKEILGQSKNALYWKTYRDTYITEKDFEFIKSKGFNCVRLPINANLFFESEVFGETAFYYIDRTFKWAEKYNLFVQLDLHALPGGQARDANADPYYGIRAAFWEHTFFRDQALDVVEAIAKRYADEPYLWSYSPACEPNTTEVELLNDYYQNAIERIRKHDSHHVILLEPNHWARDISSLETELFEDPQVSYQIHIYFFFHMDYLAMDDYPCNNAEVKFDRSDMEKMVLKSIDDKRIPLPVTMAEMGVEFSMKYFIKGVTDKVKMSRILSKGTRDMRKIMEEREGGWCLWAYKDLGRIGMVYPHANVPWNIFLKKYNDLEAWIEKQFTADFSQEQKSLSEFQKELVHAFNDIDYDTIAASTMATKRIIESLALRKVLIDMNQLSDEELINLAASFKFEHCQVRREVEDIILID